MEGIREASFGSRSHRLLAIALAMLILLGAAGQVLAQGFAQAIPGKNVDIVGPTPPFTGHAGNVLMQQNEVAGGTSLWKPNVQYAAFNDYRLVYDPDGGDAVIGFGYSTDYGKSWFSYAMPGFSKDDPSLPPGGADANIVVLPGRQGGGAVLVNHMAFWRDDSQAAELRTAIFYEHNRDVGPPASFYRNVVNNTGNSSQFHDKPSFEGMLRDPAEGLPDIILDIPPFEGPPGSSASHDGYPLPIQAARVHTCFTKFVGNADGTKVECQFTDDLINWSHAQKISESVEINQGTSIALQNFGQTMHVCWTRFEDNNDTGAVMCTKSVDWGETHSKAEVVTEFCAPHWGTGPARFRYNSLPIVTASGDNPEDVAIFFSSRNDAGQPCDVEGKGNKPGTIGMSPVRFLDDFDTFSEGPRNADGSRNKDGFVRTSRNFARIMTVRQRPNGRWGDPQQIDRQDHPAQAHSNGEPLRKNFHQIMPACESAGGIVTCSFFDTRLDRLNNLLNPIAGGFIEDVVLHFDDANGNGTLDLEDSGLVLPAGLYDQVPPPANLPPAENNFPLRRNLDVFAVQVGKNPATGQYETGNYTVNPDTWYADADGMPSSSIRVSRFATRQDPDGPIGQRQQVEFNFGGARLFDKGRAAFMSDYNSVWALSAIQQQQVFPDGSMGTVFVPNHRAPNPVTGLFPSIEPVFNLGWTSNHLVRGKVFYTGCDTWDEALQMWTGDCASTNALPEGALMPLVGEDADENPPMMCTMASTSAGPLTRNQTVMFAPMRPGVHAEVVSAIKGPSFDPTGADPQPSTFVINISNATRTDRTVMLSVEPDRSMRFDKQTESVPLLNIDVVVPRGSSNARTVFDYGMLDDPDLASTVILTVSDGPETLARLTLERSSLAPLENVQNNPDECTDPTDPSTCADLVDLLTQEFYELILKREISTTQTLDLENLDFENTTDLLDFENLDFENLDFENLDFENTLVFLDFENLDLENLDLENSLYANEVAADIVLDLENLDLENRLLFLDLENLDLENQILEFLDFENLDFENLDLENLDFENLDFENLDFENLDFENVSTIASDIENLDFENLDLENFTPTDGVATYTEVSWTADSATNTITGVDLQPVMSNELAAELLDPANNAGVLLTVRKAYMTPTVVTVSSDPENLFCTPQVVAQNQILYAALLTPAQITNAIFDGSVEDPPPEHPDTPGFFIAPDASLIISYRFINLPPDIDPHRHSGLFMPTQAGDATLCDEETPDTEINPFCEFDFPIDETAPIITLLGANPQIIEAGETYSELGATAEDDIDGDISGDIVIGVDVDTSIPDTNYSTTYNVADAAENHADTVIRVIHVVDTTAPEITAPADVTVEATGPDTPVALGMATATDAVNVSSITSDAPDEFPVGTTTVTWTATDDDDNSATAEQLVTVTDTTPPAITAPANVSEEATGQFTAVAIGTATATDAVGVTSITSDAPGTFPVGTTPVTWTAMDEEGNSATAMQSVTVTDTTPPAITAPADVTVEATGPQTTVTIGTATATDLVDPAVTISSDAPATFPVGTTIVTWTATDSQDNSASASQSVTVGDSIAPLITAPANVTVEATGPMTPVTTGTATATDAVGVISITSDAPAMFPVGTTPVTWTASDNAGNSATAVQSVTVVDTTAPVIVIGGLNPDSVDEDTGAYGDLNNVSAIDIVDGPVAVSVGGWLGDTINPGIYVINYAAMDAAGNMAIPVARTVTVNDLTAPVITSGNPPIFNDTPPIILNEGQESITLSWPVTAEDFGAGLTVACSIAGTPPIGITSDSQTYENGILSAQFSHEFPAGTSSLTCTITDDSDNSTSSDPFDVLIEDVPTAEAILDVLPVGTDADGDGSTATVFEADLIANINASDLVDEDADLLISCLSPAGTASAEFDIGEHPMTCTVTDSYGNEASASFVIDVTFGYDIVMASLKGNIRAGSTVPLDWYYTEPGTSGRADTSSFSPVVEWFGPFTNRSCTSGSDGSGDGSAAEDSGSSDFRYNDEWRLNWQTPSQGGYYNLVISPPGTADATRCIRLR